MKEKQLMLTLLSLSKTYQEEYNSEDRGNNILSEEN